MYIFNSLKTFYLETIDNFKKMVEEFKVTKNKIRVLVKYKKDILTLLATFTFVTGFVGYTFSPDSTGLEIVNNTVGLFIFAWADDDSIILDIAKFFALCTMFFGAITLYLSQSADRYEAERIQESPYTLLVGLGEQNSAFLEQLEDESSMLVIESDSNNANIERFKSRGFGVITAKAEDALSALNLAQLKNCIVSTGNDRRNIAIGLLLMEKLDDAHQKLFVRIENRDLSVLFKQEVIKSKNNVDIIAYSLYENMVKDLFAKHSVLGLQTNIIKTNRAFGTVVVGDSALVEEIVYHLAMLSVLPNENMFTLYLVAPDAKRFYAKLQKRFTGIARIPHLTIKYIDLAYDEIAFYQDEVWHSKNLTNVIIATEDEEQNLDIAVNLQDTTYLEPSVKGTLKTKVLFALYHNLGIGNAIDENKEAFANFHAFADMAEAASPENLIDEKLDLIAKLTNHNYTGSEEQSIAALNREWMALSVHKKESNKAQALHIDVKLAAMGLARVKSTKPLQERITANTQKVEAVIPKSERSRMFPARFDTLLSRLARSEHDRWNAFHYLNGWVHDTNRDDRAKRHPCLLSFSQFDADELKETYKYDVDSVLNIPLYLAHAGFELKETDHA